MATKKQQDSPLIPTSEAEQAQKRAWAAAAALPPWQPGPVVPPAVYRQMVEAASDFAKAGLAKTGVNEQQKFRFRGIDALMDLASPILVKHGLLVLPNVVSRVVEERQTRSGSMLYSVTLDVEFTIVSALDGSSHTVRFVGEAMDSGDKASNKAQSAAYKYCLLQCFCIPVDAQDEADQTTPEETVKVNQTAPEGYEKVRLAAFAHARLGGTEALRAFARELADGGKDGDGFKAWGHLVKNDPTYVDLRKIAEEADAKNKAFAAKVAADVKTEGVRVPGEEG